MRHEQHESGAVADHDTSAEQLAHAVATVAAAVRVEEIGGRIVVVVVAFVVTVVCVWVCIGIHINVFHSLPR